MNRDSDDNWLDNWLDAAQVVCQSCSSALFRVRHSPFCDDWRLYCDSCPIAVEVSFYDAHVGQLREQFADASSLLDAIARDLAPCACGGAFSHAAGRRCFSCKTVVITDAGIDLSPFIGCELDGSDPTDAQQQMHDEFEAKFVIPSAIWR